MLRIVIVGLLMGAAEVVPGVSGGTIAFVSGFYDRLVHDIQRLTPLRLLDLPRVGIRKFWRDLDLSFLVLLFSAMLASVLMLARGVSYLLINEPILIWSFFFGLVLASIVVVVRRIWPVTPGLMTAMAVGTAIGFVVTRIAPLESEVSALALFAGGCIAVCAWILPGLSGSFVLLVLGLYQTVITALKDFEVMTLAWVLAGCAVGLVSFSRILSALLDRFHNLTVAVLAGFMVGSLARIWPWKHTTSYQLKPDGSQVPVVQEPVLPIHYEAITGLDPQYLVGVAACITGIVVIIAMDRFSLLAETDTDEAAS
jgi:putative membrane protein